jgi:hypothetical protein
VTALFAKVGLPGSGRAGTGSFGIAMPPNDFSISAVGSRSPRSPPITKVMCSVRYHFR